MKQQKTNHLAVWLLVVAFQVTSILWYSPALFANQWLRYIGNTMNDYTDKSPTGIFFSIPGAVVFCYLLSFLFIKLAIKTGRDGAVVGALIAIACFALPTFTQDSFQLRPAGLSFINTGIMVINFALAGLVLGGWKKFHNL